MRIMARGHHIYRRYTAHLPEGGRMEVADGATVGQVLAQLEIPAGERPPLLVFVNGRPAGPESER